MKILKELMLVHSVSGREQAVSEKIEEMIAPYVDEVRRDAMGNLICYKKGTCKNPKKLMLAGHMDEIGFLVTGIDEKGFAQTMKAYNAAAAAQDTKGLSVPKILIGMPVTKAPFYAVPLTTTIHHTMGGLRINEKTQVLDDKGNPIPGLYAAGEITGGIHGGNRLGRNALTDLLVFGHIAGLEVTAHQN